MPMLPVWATRKVNSLSRTIGLLGAGTLVVMLLLTTADVALRYIFRKPIPGSLELSEYIMVCVVFFALAWCAAKGEHIKVDLVISRFSPRIQAAVDSITHLASLCMCVILTWQSAMESVHVRHMVSSVLKVPMFPFYCVLTLGWLLLCLVIVTQLVQYVAKAVKR